MNIRPIVSKIGVFLLALSLLTLSCTACETKEKQIRAKQIVGEVDGNPIYYDELYALAGHYLASAKAAANGDSQKLAAELDRLIQTNIVVNTAILRLCESKGLTYNQKEWSEQIDAELQSTINQSFGGDEDAFQANLTENRLTERYLRYTTGLNLLYDQLAIQYPLLGLVADGEEDVRQYISENFVHTYHLVLFYDDSNQAEKYEKMQEAHRLLQEGASMYDLIRRGYSEDFGNPSGSGYYFTKGSMEEIYETAAFSLKINEISDILDTKGADNYGGYSSCYYILQRAPLDEEYINEHFSDLQDDYYAGVIYSDLQTLQATLTFEPNSFYRSLNLTDLPAPREGLSSAAWIWIVSGCSAGLAGGITVAVLLIRKHKKKQGRSAEQSAVRSRS